MGDVLSLSVLLDPLRSALPQAEIWVLTKKKNVHILDFDSRVDHAIGTEFPWSNYSGKEGTTSNWKELWRVIKENRTKFDMGIDTRGDIRSQIVLMLLRCPIRVGYTRYLASNISSRGLLLTHKVDGNKALHRYDWNRALLAAILPSPIQPLKFPVLRLNHVSASRQEHHSSSVLVHIGGGWVFKRWRTSKWVALLKAVSALYDTEVIGGPTEAREINELQMEIPEVKCSITGEYADLVQKVSACRVFVCLDSGPMNLAVLLGKKVVALFGPGDSQMWRPYVDGLYIHKKEQYPCNPCFQRECVYPNVSCMDQIEVNEVFELVKRALS